MNGIYLKLSRPVRFFVWLCMAFLIYGVGIVVSNLSVAQTNSINMNNYFVRATGAFGGFPVLMLIVMLNGVVWILMDVFITLKSSATQWFDHVIKGSLYALHFATATAFLVALVADSWLFISICAALGMASNLILIFAFRAHPPLSSNTKNVL